MPNTQIIWTSEIIAINIIILISKEMLLNFNSTDDTCLFSETTKWDEDASGAAIELPHFKAWRKTDPPNIIVCTEYGVHYYTVVQTR